MMTREQKLKAIARAYVETASGVRMLDEVWDIVYESARKDSDATVEFVDQFAARLLDDIEKWQKL